MASWVRFGVALSLLAPACGGIVEVGSRENQQSAGDASTSGDAPAKSGSTLPVEGDIELGQCQLGESEGTSDICPWVVERRCYATREMACNCACPRSRDSQCVSGFEAGPRGHVMVTWD